MGYRGIAMIESMLAITIIMIAIMAPLTISTYTSRYAKLALNRIVATYMAEEPLEMIVNLRKSLDIYCFNVSSNCANGDSFDEFYNTIFGAIGCGTIAAPCYIDESAIDYPISDPPIKPVFTPFTNINDCRYLFINENDISTCTALNAQSVSSPFTRKLVIEAIDNLSNQDRVGSFVGTKPNGVKLTSIVCINKPNCTLGDNSAITLVYNIYR